MRIQLPQNFSEDNVTVLANSLFVHFANDFSKFISNFMENKFGPLWLQDLKINYAQYRNFNPKDPAALLKDLARNGSSQLRQALNTKIDRGFRKNYYEDLDDLLGERNAWLHRQVQESKSELLDLIVILIRVSQPLALEVVEDCLYLQGQILGPKFSDQNEKFESFDQDLKINTLISAQNEKSSSTRMTLGDPVSENIDTGKNDEKTPKSMHAGQTQVGEPINERLLSHSYVLHLDGEISDRSSGELLSHFFPESALTIGKNLLQRKASGGRIRVTEDGILCAFFGDQWGYLGTVDFDRWFPNHLEQPNKKGQ